MYPWNLKPAEILSRFPADLESDEHTAGGRATTAENHQHQQGALLRGWYPGMLRRDFPHASAIVSRGWILIAKTQPHGRSAT